VPEKSVTFYAYWANRYLTFSKYLKNAGAAEGLRRFVEDLQSRENIADWQIQQAQEAIQSYTNHFYAGEKAGIADDDAKTTFPPFDKDWVMVNRQKAIRVKHSTISPFLPLKKSLWACFRGQNREVLVSNQSLRVARPR
jgi:hypothetical protein